MLLYPYTRIYIIYTVKIGLKRLGNKHRIFAHAPFIFLKVKHFHELNVTNEWN